MSVIDQLPPTDAARATSLDSAVQAIVAHRGVRVVAALWVVGSVFVLWLAQGSLPFDRPAVAALPFSLQVAMPTLGMIEIFILTVVTFLLTSARAIPDMAARAPERRVALRETIGVLAYAFVGQVGGWVVGPALGYRPFSFHIAGTVFGCSFPPTRAEVGSVGALQSSGIRRGAIRLLPSAIHQH